MITIERMHKEYERINKLMPKYMKSLGELNILIENNGITVDTIPKIESLTIKIQHIGFICTLSMIILALDGDDRFHEFESQYELPDAEDVITKYGEYISTAVEHLDTIWEKVEKIKEGVS